MASKNVIIKFIGDSSQDYQELCSAVKSTLANEFQVALHRSITQKCSNIVANPLYGERIAKNKIPKEYTRGYGIDNLYWVKLVNNWRLLYSLSRGMGVNDVNCSIVDYLDHKSYFKKFRY